jgi:hypothetical protein
VILPRILPPDDAEELGKYGGVCEHLRMRDPLKGLHLHLLAAPVLADPQAARIHGTVAVAGVYARRRIPSALCGVLKAEGGAYAERV